MAGRLAARAWSACSAHAGEAAEAWAAKHEGPGRRNDRRAVSDVNWWRSASGNDDDDVRAVVAEALQPFLPAVIVDHTTTSAKGGAGDGRPFAGGRRLGCPVGGNRTRARGEDGQLTIMCGGGASFAKADYCGDLRLPGQPKANGGPGAGQLVQCAIRSASRSLVPGLGRGGDLRAESGLNTTDVWAISKRGPNPGRWTTAGRPWRRSKFEFGFAVDWMQKDCLAWWLDGAQTNRAHWMTALVDQFYAKVQAMGDRRWEHLQPRAPLPDDVAKPTALLRRAVDGGRPSQRSSP